MRKSSDKAKKLFRDSSHIYKLTLEETDEIAAFINHNKYKKGAFIYTIGTSDKNSM